MELTSHQELNRSFLKLTKRAETSDRNQLVNTFVDEGYLFTLLSSPEHQVIYGRRGTRKTHALLYLAETVSSSGSLPVYLDMRTVGSTGGLYADAQLPFSERATRLLMDTLSAIHEAILTFSVNSDVDDVNLSVIGPLLDEFATAITQVIVSGEVEIENALTSRDERESSNELGLTGGLNALSGRANSQQRYTDSTEGEIRQRNSGEVDPRIETDPLVESDRLSERGRDEKAKAESLSSVQGKGGTRGSQRGKDVG